MVGSNEIASPNKRQKIAQQNGPTYDMGIVLLQLRERFVAQVPLLNFQTFAPGKVKSLVEISESATHRWKFYTYTLSIHCPIRSVEQWASWLTHRDLRWISTSEPDNRSIIHVAISDAERFEDVAFQGVLMDAWIWWLRDDNPAGCLSVNRLRCFGRANCPGVLYDLKRALILHHDASALAVDDIDPDEEFPYGGIWCRNIRKLAMGYFFQAGKEPKDPLQLSDDEFCKSTTRITRRVFPATRQRLCPKRLDTSAVDFSCRHSNAKQHNNHIL